MSTTSIQWTEKVWNPTRGCSRVSAGCENCYAERQALRFSGEGLPYHGLVRRDSHGKAQWTGKVVLVPEMLSAPLRPKGGDISEWVGDIADLAIREYPCSP